MNVHYFMLCYTLPTTALLKFVQRNCLNVLAQPGKKHKKDMVTKNVVVSFAPLMQNEQYYSP